MRPAPLPAFLLGIAPGRFSVTGDRLPVDSPLVVLVALANAGGPWLVAAFVAGAFATHPHGGSTAGALVLGVGVIGQMLLEPFTSWSQRQRSQLEQSPAASIVAE